MMQSKQTAAVVLLPTDAASIFCPFPTPFLYHIDPCASTKWPQACSKMLSIRFIRHRVTQLLSTFQGLKGLLDRSEVPVSKKLIACALLETLMICPEVNPMCSPACVRALVHLLILFPAAVTEAGTAKTKRRPPTKRMCHG